MDKTQNKTAGEIVETRREDITESIQGFNVSDPYRWLEDGESQEVQEWTEKQNQRVGHMLKNETFETLSAELAEGLHKTTFTVPALSGGYYFYTERTASDEQAVLYAKKGIEGEAFVLFNPNANPDGQKISIDYWRNSRTGKYIAYGISEGGDEMATLYIKNVHTNTLLEGQIPHCRHASVMWLADDSGFYYTRNPMPGTVPKDEEHLHTKVHFHAIGQNPDADEMIFGEGRPKDDMISIKLSPDNIYLSIHVSTKWTENELYIYHTGTKETKPLVTGIPAKFNITFLKDKVLVMTNHKANNYKVLSNVYSNLFDPIDTWQEFIPEREQVLLTYACTKTKIYAEYMMNAYSSVHIFDHQGVEVGTIPLPPYSSLDRINTNREEDEFFYSVSSFLSPATIYRYNPATGEYELYRQRENMIQPEDFVVTQEWYISKDGTKVPMFIVKKKDVIADGKNPTILYGYGGFNSSETPYFRGLVAPWLNRGGIFAVANIRGGGEFGGNWHQAGIGKKKQNSYDDFIAVSEYLIAQKYTSSEHLSILGGSNGGLLVATVAVQRPDLYRAVCSEVPLIDMVRFSKFGIARRWVHEYGDPETAEGLESILKWSPYHIVKEDTHYPDFLFTTAKKDTRVDPFHARKMAAKLQSAHSENVVLIFTETDAGHGPGKPVAKIVEGNAYILTFFAERLGLRV